MTGDRRGGVQSVETAAGILAAMAAADGPQSLKSLAAAAGLAPAKAHRYLVSLVRGGLVEQDPASGRYALGGLALHLGLAALRRLDVVELAAAALADLGAAIDETALLAVWGNRGPVVIRWREASHPVTVNVRIGSVMPLLRSATGRVFLAYLPEAATAAMLQDELAVGADESVPDVPRSAAQSRSLAADVRERGLARVQGQMLPGVAALSAPVFQHDGSLQAVLTVLGPEPAFDVAWSGANAVALTASARALSARLGYHAPPETGGR